MSNPTNVSYDEDISVGKPTAKELQEYFQNAGKYPPLDSSDSSYEEDQLTDSFQEFLDKRLKNIRDNKMSNFDEADYTSSAFDNSSITEGIRGRDSSLGGDDTFARMEEMCDQTNPLEKLGEDFDLTQLNDIEAPSNMWENTIHNFSKILSPVKMCGMLRPSTIIEEDSHINSTTSSSGSILSSVSTNELVRLIDDVVDVNRYSGLEDTCTTTNSATYYTSYKTANTIDESEYVEASRTSSKPEATESADDTYATASDANSSKTISVCSSKISVIESESLKPSVYVECYEKSKYPASYTTSAYETADSHANSQSNIIEINSSDTDDESCAINNNTLEDVDSIKTESFSDSLEKADVDLNSSHEFNDTLEEMDYMMKKGLQFMEQQKLQTTNVSASTQTPPSALKSIRPETPDTVIKRPLASVPNVTKATPNVGATMNDDRFFAKPSFPKLKPAPFSGQKKNKYDYVVSPLHMYIHNTPVAPLTSNERSSRRDIFDSKLSNMRDSRYYPDSKSTKENIETAKISSTGTAPTYNFPRKAYISADTKHVVDEREIPKLYGGDKINRLFGGHNSPTIIRHEGHIRTNPARERIIDSSLSDLSIDHGDVSFQVLKNAEKF